MNFLTFRDLEPYDSNLCRNCLRSFRRRGYLALFLLDMPGFKTHLTAFRVFNEGWPRGTWVSIRQEGFSICGQMGGFTLSSAAGVLTHYPQIIEITMRRIRIPLSLLNRFMEFDRFPTLKLETFARSIGDETRFIQLLTLWSLA